MEISRIISEVGKLGEYEYGVVQSDSDYYIALSSLNKAIGVVEYFKPKWEDIEYDEWEKNYMKQKEEREKDQDKRLQEMVRRRVQMERAKYALSLGQPQT